MNTFTNVRLLVLLLFLHPTVHATLTLKHVTDQFSLYSKENFQQIGAMCGTHSLVKSIFMARELTKRPLDEHFNIIEKVEFPVGHDFYRQQHVNAIFAHADLKTRQARWANTEYDGQGLIFYDLSVGALDQFADEHKLNSAVFKDESEHVFFCRNPAIATRLSDEEFSIYWQPKITSQLRAGKSAVFVFGQPVVLKRDDGSRYLSKIVHWTSTCIIPLMVDGRLRHLHIISVNSDSFSNPDDIPMYDDLFIRMFNSLSKKCFSHPSVSPYASFSLNHTCTDTTPGVLQKAKDLVSAGCDLFARLRCKSRRS